MKKLIASINDDKYKLIDIDKDNGLYYGYNTEWEFSYEGKSFIDEILIVRSEPKINTDPKQRNNGIARFEEVLKNLKNKLNSNRYKSIDSVEKRIETINKK